MILSTNIYFLINFDKPINRHPIGISTGLTIIYFLYFYYIYIFLYIRIIRFKFYCIENGIYRIIFQNSHLNGFHPFAGISVLLFDNVRCDGSTTIVGWLLPFEVHVLLVPVLNLRFSWRIGLTWIIIYRVLVSYWKFS